MKSTGERLRSKLAVNPETRCWEWTARLDHRGYGRVWFDGMSRVAHRVAYLLWVGPIPEGMQLDHLCRVRHCVNPAHLEPVTPRENNLRGAGTGGRLWTSPTHCIRGHEFDEANTYNRPDGDRDCRTCLRAASRAWKDRNRDALTEKRIQRRKAAK